MGRSKIKIEKIDDERKRAVTFGKRKSGLFKKVMELSVLCDAKALLVLFDENGSLSEYSSTDDPKDTLRRYFSVAHVPHEKYTNSDYETLFVKEPLEKEKRKMLKKPAIPHRKTPVNHAALFSGFDITKGFGLLPQSRSQGYAQIQPFPPHLKERHPIPKLTSPSRGQNLSNDKMNKIPQAETPFSPSQFLTSEFQSPLPPPKPTFPAFLSQGTSGFTPIPRNGSTTPKFFQRKMLPSKKRIAKRKTALTIEVPDNRNKTPVHAEEEELEPPTLNQSASSVLKVTPLIVTPLTPLNMANDMFENGMIIHK